jgi:hypothetical protein
VRIAIAVLVVVGSLAVARGAREALPRDSADMMIEDPFAPTPGSAPIFAAGYRELAADLLYARLRVYFGGRHNSATGVASMVEAIVALDPAFYRIYELGARAMTTTERGLDQPTYLRAVAVLETGVRQFPDDWRIPLAAGQMYMVDLTTTDPAQRRAWDERGALLLESAIRKPGAPQEAAITVAHLRTKLGQHDRAVAGLRETLLLTNDPEARQRILDKLAELDHADARELAAELLEARRRFEARWKAERPALTPTMYVLLGPHPAPGFDPADLATGGRDLVGTELLTERLEPLE